MLAKNNSKRSLVCLLYRIVRLDGGSSNCRQTLEVNITDRHFCLPDVVLDLLVELTFGKCTKSLRNVPPSKLFEPCRLKQAHLFPPSDGNKLFADLFVRLSCSSWIKIKLSIYKFHRIISINPQMSATFCRFVRSIDNMARTWNI